MLTVQSTRTEGLGALTVSAWDNDNHLFALSYKTGTLYVYTVTPTSLMEAAGSPYQVPNAYGFRG